MELKEIQNQALQLPISDRWSLVQTLLSSLEKETLLVQALPEEHPIEGLDPWTKSLIGVIRLESEDSLDSYVNYLEEKYS